MRVGARQLGHSSRGAGQRADLDQTEKRIRNAGQQRVLTPQLVGGELVDVLVAVLQVDAAIARIGRLDQEVTRRLKLNAEAVLLRIRDRASDFGEGCSLT